MNVKLFFSAIAKFSLGVILLGLLIFLPAGTFDFAGGWLLMCILFIPMFVAGIVMMIFNPELLKSRLKAKETQKTQDLVVKLSGLMFILSFVLSGLDYRFSWIKLPFEINIAGAVVFIIAYVIYAEVLRENTYLSRTIEVKEGQKVVSSGLYGIVRHPMYFATILLFMAMPFVLGSLIGFIPLLFYPFIIAARIKNEEEVLTKELDGYSEYKNKVKYRMIPFIW
jgi:protein-S-isoprenylcysteine O-methyltransferase Ste14